MTSTEAHNINELYTDTLKVSIQQDTSVLRALVTQKPFAKGEMQSMDSIGPVALNPSTAINSPVAMQDISRYRRWFGTQSYEGGHMYDNLQALREGHDPAGAIAQGYRAAASRLYDSVIIKAFDTLSLEGKSAGALTPTPFPKSQVLQHNNEGLTRDKYERAVRMTRRAYHNKQSTLAVAMTGQQEEDMLDSTTITSGDFNSMRPLPLVNHELPYWGGAYRYLIEDHGIPNVSNNGVGDSAGHYEAMLSLYSQEGLYTGNAHAWNPAHDKKPPVRRIFFFLKEAMGFAEQEPFKSQMGHPDGHRIGSWRFQCQLTVGGVRLSERGIVAVDCIDNSVMHWG